MAQPRMSYSRRRYEALRKLGIEQLPTLRMSDAADTTQTPLLSDLPVRTMPVGPCEGTLIMTTANEKLGAWTQMPSMREQRPDCLGHSRQALSSMRHPSQLSSISNLGLPAYTQSNSSLTTASLHSLRGLHQSHHITIHHT